MSLFILIIPIISNNNKDDKEYQDLRELSAEGFYTDKKDKEKDDVLER